MSLLNFNNAKYDIYMKIYIDLYALDHTSNPKPLLLSTHIFYTVVHIWDTDCCQCPKYEQLESKSLCTSHIDIKSGYFGI